jgi:hypothetical protein
MHYTFKGSRELVHFKTADDNPTKRLFAMMKTRMHTTVFFRAVALCCLCFILQRAFALNLQPNPATTKTRRAILNDFVSTTPPLVSILIVGGGVVLQPNVVHAADGSFSEMLGLVKQARQQLNPIPKLIENEKWDSVRAILIEPPLSDCWARTGRPLLTKFAEALGDVGGDELAALEAREEIVSHLRYLDMAVYNNNFNPIKSEGENGASAALIRSYYEDPKNEYKSSLTAFDELLGLSSGL